jgi:hypothetical protein
MRLSLVILSAAALLTADARQLGASKRESAKTAVRLIEAEGEAAKYWPRWARTLRAKIGTLLYQGRLGVAKREGFSGSPIAVDGKVFFTNDDGETFVLKGGREFNLLHTNQLGDATYASPALVDGRWYFRTASSLVAIGD